MLARPSMHRAAATAMRSIRSPVPASTASNSLTAASAPAPPSIPLIFGRTLVSTVLLSRDGYDSRKVTELKEELKRRGLSTTGRRDILVARLLEDDTRRAGSNSAAGAPVAAPGAAQRRNNTSLASLRASSPNSPPPVSPGTAGAEAASGVGNDKATVSHPPHIQPGQVSGTTNAQNPSAGFTQALEKVVPELNPPGVPPQKTASVPRAEFNIKIPYYEDPPIPGPEIPLVTAYFDPAHRTPHEEPAPLKTKKVLTVSAPETYPGGGVAHHAADFGDDSLDIAASEGKGGEGSSSRNSSGGVVDEVVSAIRQDLGLGGGESKTVEAAAGQAGASVGAMAQGLVQDARSALGGAAEKVADAASTAASSASTSSGSGSSSSGGDYNRPLNAEERSGALVLGALVAGGILAGGLGKPSKKSVEEKRKKLQAIDDEIHRVEHGQAPSSRRIPAELLRDADLETLVRAAQEALRD